MRTASGREIGEMSYHQRRTADSLVKLGLVELTRGRDLRFWFRLTEKGRRVREEGEGYAR